MKSTISSAMMIPVIPIPPNLPVGYRFDPKDEELIGYYLVMFLRGFYSHDMPIGIVNFWELEPWELPGIACLFQFSFGLRSIGDVWMDCVFIGRSRIQSDDQVWYFFCKRVPHADKKKKMFQRKTQAGRWKPTSGPTVIDDLGRRNTLRFYKDSPKVEKTEWIAYEYEITPNSTLSNPDEFVIMKLMNSPGEKRFKIKTKMPKHKSKVMSTSTNDQSLDEVTTTSDNCSHQVPADFGNQDVGNTTFSISNQSNQMASACEMMDIAPCNGHEVVPSDYTVEMSAMSTHDTGEPSSRATSSCQNHLSVAEVQERGYSSMRPENQEEYEQANCLFASDLENENLPSEVEDSPPKITCTENQLALDETNPSCSMTSRPEDYIQNEEFNLSDLEFDLSDLPDFEVDKETNETFPEVDVGFLAELHARHELQHRRNPAVQQTIRGDQ